MNGLNEYRVIMPDGRVVVRVFGPTWDASYREALRQVEVRGLAHASVYVDIWWANGRCGLVHRGLADAEVVEL